MQILELTLIGLIAAATPSVAQEDEPAPTGSEKTPTEEPSPPRIYWDSGAMFRPRQGNFRMKVGGQAQIDTAGFVSDGSQPVALENGVEWRRARIYALGSFARRWSFKFQWDFANGRSPSLTDAWLGLDFTVWAQTMHLRSGRFSSTFGLENDGSSNDFLFMEQGLTSAFVPPQETGVTRP